MQAVIERLAGRGPGWLDRQDRMLRELRAELEAQQAELDADRSYFEHLEPSPDGQGSC